MSFFGKKSRTAQQKAQWAKTSLLIRVVALGYIIFYVIVPLFQQPAEDAEAMNPAVRYSIAGAFIIATAYLTVQTIITHIRNQKGGLYNADAYKDDEVPGDTSESSEPEDTEDDDYEYDEDDDEYEDDDYDDDDEDDDEYDDEYEDDDDEYEDDDDDEDEEYDDEDDEYDEDE